MYTYSIFDANPGTSGSCAWPHHDHREIDGALTEVSERVKATALEEGLACRDYRNGDRLWINIWSEHSIAWSGVVTIRRCAVVWLERGMSEESVLEEALESPAVTGTEEECRAWMERRSGDAEFGFAIVNYDGEVDYGDGYGCGWPSARAA